MKPSVEAIQNNRDQSFKLEVHENVPACKNQQYWHIHPEYEIVYIHNGLGKCHIGNHISMYSDGKLVMLGPHIPHLPLGNHQYKDNFEVVVQFTEEFMQEKLGVFPELQGLMDLKRRSKLGLSFGSETKCKIQPYIKPGADFSNAERLIWLIQLLTELSQAKDVQSLNVHGLSNASRQNDYARIQMIYHYISTHFDQDITLEMLAGEVGLTKNSLCRFFKKTTGKTVLGYLTEYRINMAKEFLLDGSLSVSEVLYRSGFNDPTFFHKKFKAYTDCTPKAFRKFFTSQNPPPHQKSDRIHLLH